MGQFIADQMAKLMVKEGVDIRGGRILVLGLAFKENCPDTRNSRVVEIITFMKDWGLRVDVYDPWVDVALVRDQYAIELLEQLPQSG